jgi:hypothetical protein
MTKTQPDKQAELAVIDCFACPSTGTTFILVLTETNRKIVIWAITNRLLHPGEKILINEGELRLRGDYDLCRLIIMSNMEAGIWKNIKKSMTCPGSLRSKPEICNYKMKCHFESCPYNIQTYTRNEEQQS